VPEPWKLGADGLGGYGKELTLKEPVLTLYFFGGKKPWKLGADGLGGYGKELTLKEPPLTLYCFDGKMD